MRTTLDLVSELHEASEGAFVGCLMVGFPDTIEFVFNSSRDPLEDLNKKVDRGGQPIGIVICVKNEDSLDVKARPLRECADDPVIRDLIPRYLETFKKDMAAFAFNRRLPSESIRKID